MKKLLGISALALLLAACSQTGDRPQPSQEPPKGLNPQVEKALSECQAAVGEQSKDQVKFDACMKEKGFERPTVNPQVEKALKECEQAVGQTKDQIKFDACMKQKGFERPSAPPAAQEPPSAATP